MANEKILIVDDDPDITAAISKVLQAEQYAVANASNGTEAMEKIKADRPNLIILDVMMTTMSEGFDICRDLKKDPEYKDIPILMLTSIEERTGIPFKSSAGDPVWLPVDEFLDKPVEPELLLAKVRALLSKAS
jgi:CheY-like chemotaxis protein